MIMEAKMKRWLIVLSLLASLLLGASVVSAQDGVDNPLNFTIDVSDAVKVDLGFNDAVPAVFVSPKAEKDAKTAIGALVDLITVRIEETGDERLIIGLLKESDPAFGIGTYYDGEGDTRAGPVLTVKMSRPIQWLVKEVTGWVVQESTAAAMGDKIDARIGAAYTAKVDTDNWKLYDWEMNLVGTIGVTLSF